MARCLDCGCMGADPDWGLCFECFSVAYGHGETSEEPTTQEYCDSYGHPPYDDEHMLCYCGQVYTIMGSIGI